MIRAAGVDIDLTRTTFAWRTQEWRTQKLTKWEIVQCTTVQNEHAILEAIRLAGIELVAIEKPYLGKNVKTYGQLSEVFGRIAGLCNLVGIPWKGTFAEVWQRGMLSQGNYLPGGRDRKVLSKIVAKEGLGAEPRNDDEADAICLAGFEEQGDLR